MTPNLHQEAMSRAHIYAVAAQAGATISRPEFDYGIDFTLTEIRLEAGRWGEAGPKFDVQLKSVREDDDLSVDFGYDLDVGAYDDLRKELDLPRLLVLVALPVSHARWSAHGSAGLLLRGRAYWLSLRGAKSVPNTKTKRVTIPTTNQFTAAALAELFNRQRRGEFK